MDDKIQRLLESQFAFFKLTSKRRKSSLTWRWAQILAAIGRYQEAMHYFSPIVRDIKA
ncbi:MAG: hypothetical protein HZA51_16980 [Planctomycetes bacterium]|nr:hypothetical protein [Planctomycetota bacterium]